jgi:hypothetical protein
MAAGRGEYVSSLVTMQSQGVGCLSHPPCVLVVQLLC